MARHALLQTHIVVGRVRIGTAEHAELLRVEVNSRRRVLAGRAGV